MKTNVAGQEISNSDMPCHDNMDVQNSDADQKCDGVCLCLNAAQGSSFNLLDIAQLHISVQSADLTAETQDIISSLNHSPPTAPPKSISL